LAGALLAAIAVPEQLATARLAGMPVQTGLYAFAAGSLAFAVFGVNRFMSVGADSTIAPIFAGSIAVAVARDGHEYAEMAGLVALVAGLTLVLVGVLRAGWVADLLSTPVTVGILAGISAHIVVGQLPSILGIAAPQGWLVYRFFDELRALPHANLYAVAIGASVFAVTFVGERLSPRIPSALVALVGSGFAVVFLHLQAKGVATLQPLPTALPAIALPWSTDTAAVLHAIPIGVIVALTCIVQTATVVRVFATSDPEGDDLARDFAGVGAGSIAAAFVGAFAVDSSPPRTAIVQEAGGKSQLASVVAVAIVAAFVLLGSSSAAYLPEAALGGVLLFIATRIFKLGAMRDIARRSGFEVMTVIAGALLVIVFPIETGMVGAIMLSLGLGIYQIARPPSTELLRLKGTTIWWPPTGDGDVEKVPGVVVFSPAAPISFTNGHFIAERLMATVAAEQPGVKLVVIEAATVIYVDYTGSGILMQAVTALRSQGIDVAVARLSDRRAQAAAQRCGLIDAIGSDHVFKSVYEAITALG